MPSRKLNPFLTQLEFTTAHVVEGRTSVADLFSRSKRCGIYMLECSTGEVYAGQAVDVTRRYVQHLKNHKDVIRLHFRQVPRARLDAVEREVIHTLQEEGLKTRNITFSSTIEGETDLDVVMPPDVQSRFERDHSFNDATGRRTVDDDIRRRLAPRHERFRNRAGAGEVLEVLRAYVPRCIPAYLRTELSFWELSLPPRPPWVYARLNVAWQEVLTAVEEEDGTLWYSFHVAASPMGLLGKPKSAMKRVASSLGVDILERQYQWGGPDQVRVVAPQRDALRLIGEEEQFQRAARLLNLRLMRKAPTPYGKFHCFGLADEVLARAS